MAISAQRVALLHLLDTDSSKSESRGSMQRVGTQTMVLRPLFTSGRSARPSACIRCLELSHLLSFGSEDCVLIADRRRLCQRQTFTYGFSRLFRIRHWNSTLGKMKKKAPTATAAVLLIHYFRKKAQTSGTIILTTLQTFFFFCTTW